MKVVVLGVIIGLIIVICAVFYPSIVEMFGGDSAKESPAKPPEIAEQMASENELADELGSQDSIAPDESDEPVGSSAEPEGAPEQDSSGTAFEQAGASPAQQTAQTEGMASEASPAGMLRESAEEERLAQMAAASDQTQTDFAASSDTDFNGQTATAGATQATPSTQESIRAALAKIPPIYAKEETSWKNLLQERLSDSILKTYPYSSCFAASAAENRLPVSLVIALSAMLTGFDAQASFDSKAGIMLVGWPTRAEDMGINRKK
ncbi:hypothetical protein J7M28_10305, partial [bacterium]|nr:hypothetical protein [bacterium]